MFLKLAAAVVSLAVMAGAAAAQTAGSYDRLPVGERGLVDALYDAQQSSADKPALTRDDIAGRKGTAGWGNVFKDLKAAGYYPDAKNFGEVVSAYRHERNDLRKEQRSADRADWKAERRETAQRPERPEKVERLNKPERIR